MGGDFGTFLVGPFFAGVAHNRGLVGFAGFLAFAAWVFPVWGAWSPARMRREQNHDRKEFEELRRNARFFSKGKCGGFEWVTRGLHKAVLGIEEECSFNLLWEGLGLEFGLGFRGGGEFCVKIEKEYK